MADEPPEATPFAALGAGNGFPACLPRLDVDTADYWTTLGGFNKNSAGSPTEFQIAKSKENAMKLFWNLYGFTGEATITSSLIFDPSRTRDVTDLSVEDNTSISPSGFEEPYNRVCLKGGQIDDEIVNEDESQIKPLLYNKFYSGSESEGFPYIVLQVFSNFSRYYLNGQYVGVGFSGRLNAYGDAALVAEGSGIPGDPFSWSSSTVKLTGWVEDYPGSLSLTDAEKWTKEIKYITFSNMPFISFAGAYAEVPTNQFQPEATRFVDATNVTAKASWPAAPTPDVSTTTITGLDFYTYP